MPSESEPFGLVALESSILGCPVIMSSKSGAAEVLPSAIKCDPSDIVAWVENVERILSDNVFRKKYCKSLRREAKKCSWDQCTAGILDCYRAVC
ncbi:hypothetical protein GEMRC1_006135 [Eukaryota sp. GEM-RC1]